MTRPFTYVFQLWFIGTLFMFRLGCLISHIRRTLRPGVLSWIRDPEDPDFQPIKEILERKTLTHLRKIGASATMYGGLIVCLFGVTCFLFGQLVKGTELLPLRLSGRPPFVPLDLLCVVFVLPALAKLTRPLKRASSISRRWWRFATYRLGIAEYFFEPKRIAAGARDSAKKEPSFYARVPDSDNSILGSPLMIQVDEGGQPISERGKEALQVQEEKIAKMKEPKAKYKVLCLPVGFGRRVKLLLFFLWASMAVGALVTVFVPIIVGRWILGDQADHHDVYAFTRGIIALSPLFPLADLLSRTKTAQWKLDRPSWGGEGKLQGNRRARRELRQSLWWTRPSTPLAKKRLRLRMRRWAWRAGNAAVILMSFGLLMPALVGLTVDQREYPVLQEEERVRTLTDSSSLRLFSVSWRCSALRPYPLLAHPSSTDFDALRLGHGTSRAGSLLSRRHSATASRLVCSRQGDVPTRSASPCPALLPTQRLPPYSGELSPAPLSPASPRKRAGVSS